MVEQVQSQRSAEPDILLSEVTKTYRSAQKATAAVESASLHVSPNEFVSLIGPSGCGKTTLLKMVADIVSISDGSIRIGGLTPREARHARWFGFVFQEAALLPWRTVLENIALPGEVIPGRAANHVTPQELLGLVGLEGFANHFPHELSGGMQQRVAIARALSFDPPILLMDEPFGALDLLTRERMSLELLRIWETRKKTVLFVTHSINEAVLLSDRVAVFSARPGRILEVVPIQLRRPRTPSMIDDPEFVRHVSYLRHRLSEGVESRS